ncbi:MAG: UDP-N-acetylmuramyl pentapeptide phosphotransferase [Deltaproteobacteria bacterium]|nr:UDP-N-acetylmuramyl pentapeptide phosphotransferase [Deltaproteobacteria bacterium]
MGSFLISRYGIKLGLADIPSNRSSHIEVVPKGGGIGILLSFLFASIILNIEFKFLCSVFFISILSFYGDKLEISPLFRLIVHLLGSLLIIYNINFHDNFILNLLIIFISVVFIAGTANFYNFMDGINGIAALTGVICFSFVALYIHLNGTHYFFKILSICLAFGCLGFLPFNLPKAKVFMGDVGSMLLGICFGSFVIILSNSMVDFLCLISFLFPFYADELLTMLIRIKDGESLSRPHRRHLYQLFVNELKFEHYKITILYGLIQIIISTVFIFFKDYGLLTLFLLHLFFLGIFSFLFIKVRNKVQRLNI